MNLENCWEFMGCGRQPGGENAREHGICLAAVDESSHGLNGGTNGGRICWTVTGHFSEARKVRCRPARDIPTCTSCLFFKKVLREQTISRFILTQEDESVEPHT